MTIIRPITDLRNTNAISELCHKSKDPVFITKNGYGDMVIMSMDAYEAMTAQLQALTVAACAGAGLQGAPFSAVQPAAPAIAVAAQQPPALPVQQPVFTHTEEPESEERIPDEDFGGLRVIREKYLKTKIGSAPAR